MTPAMTIAHSGRAEGRLRSEGTPGGAVHGPPLIPRPPGADPRPRPNAHAGGECADNKRGARVGNRGPPPRGRAGMPRRDPPPTAPTGPQAAGAPDPNPRGGGVVPPPPARERSRSTARGPAPPASSHRNRGEQASSRQRAGTPHRSRPEKAGQHEPERYGGHAPMTRTTPVTPALLPAQGRQRDGTRQSDPPPYWPPRPHTRGVWRTPPPPPPRPAPRHTNATDPPHGGRTAPSQVGGNQDRTAPPQGRQTEQGTGAGHAEGHRPRETALPAPSAGTARGAHATPPRRGGRGRRGSVSAHARKGHAGTTRRAT